jgi:flagellar biosynthesis regulator FlbT
MNKQVLNEQIQDKVFFFTEQLNDLIAKEDNTYIPKTIKRIDKLVNNLYTELYGLVDSKKVSAIEDKKCGHCG